MIEPRRARRARNEERVVGPLVALLALAFAACTPEPAPAPPPPPPPLVALAARTLEFTPSRADLTVGKAVLHLHAARPAAVRLNGAPVPEAWHLVDLARVGPNRFALPAVRLEAAEPDPGLVCVSVKVWFEQVDNQHDALYYANGDDRYALVSFATRADGPEWELARPRFAQNRVATLADLEAALSRPLPIRLNDRPLSDAGR